MTGAAAKEQGDEWGVAAARMQIDWPPRTPSLQNSPAATHARATRACWLYESGNDTFQNFSCWNDQCVLKLNCQKRSVDFYAQPGSTVETCVKPVLWQRCWYSLQNTGIHPHSEWTHESIVFWHKLVCAGLSGKTMMIELCVNTNRDIHISAARRDIRSAAFVLKFAK